MNEANEASGFEQAVSILDEIRKSAREAYALPYYMLRTIQHLKSSSEENACRLLTMEFPSLTKTNVYGVGGMVEEVTVHGHVTCYGGKISDYLLLFAKESNSPAWMKELLTNVSLLLTDVDGKENNGVLVQVRLIVKEVMTGNCKIVRSKVIIGDYELCFGRHMSSSNSKMYNDYLWGHPWIQVSHKHCKQDQALVFLHKVLMLHRSGNILSAISDRYGIIPEDERELIKFIDPRAKILLDKEPEGFTIINSTDTLPETFTIRNQPNAFYVI